ncbi:MAG: hypothetical protein IPO18_09825 [bacterium]|nr:hypothetical protein [bacterium]
MPPGPVTCTAAGQVRRFVVVGQPVAVEVEEEAPADARLSGKRAGLDVGGEGERGQRCVTEEPRPARCRFTRCQRAAFQQRRIVEAVSRRVVRGVAGQGQVGIERGNVVRLQVAHPDDERRVHGFARQVAHLHGQGHGAGLRVHDEPGAFEAQLDQAAVRAGNGHILQREGAGDRIEPVAAVFGRRGGVGAAADNGRQGQ